MSGSVTVVTYPATVSVVDSAVTVSVVDQAVTVEAGSSGPQGVAGPAGPAGATGPKGDTGDTGVVAATSPITYDSGTKTVAFDQAANNSTNDTRYARLGAANAFTVGGHTITNTVAATIPLVIKAAASQSANLQEWQNSGGAALASINSSGHFNGIQSLLAQTNAGAIVLRVRGAASQTANLQQWQNSAGTVLASLTSAGRIYGTGLYTSTELAQLFDQNGGGQLLLIRATAAATNPGASKGSLYFRDGTTAGTLKLVVRAGTAGAETTILDNIPQ